LEALKNMGISAGMSYYKMSLIIVYASLPLGSDRIKAIASTFIYRCNMN